MSFVLAYDFGSTNVRGALVDRQGHICHMHTIPSPGGPTANEVDPQHWWDAWLEIANTLAAAAGPAFAAITGIAICGVTRTQVFLNAAGRVLRPALTWRDARAAERADQLAALAPPGWPELAHLNAFHPAARIAWLAQAEPALFADLAAVVDPKDYLNARLTGRVASDVVSSARLLAAGQTWPDGDDVFARAGLPRRLLEIAFLRPTDRVGTVCAGLPWVPATLVGTPVFSLANDTWATVVGMGALRQGMAYNISGTTEVFGTIGATPVSAQGLLSVDWGQGVQQIGGPSQCGADTLAWFMALLAGANDPGDIATVLAQPRQTAPALFLPFLSGERTPYWEPALRAAWFGLHRQHGATDLAYAILEGVAFLNRTVLERAEAAMGQQAAEIRFGGGGATNATWCQIKADVTCRPMAVAAAPQPGLLGCAIAAWTGLGAYADLPAAQDSLVQIARTYRPDPAKHAAYSALFEVWAQAVAAARPIAQQLAGFRLP
jgi:xylulokinase